MTSFYEDNYEDYFKSTAAVDPTSFLLPFVKKLSPGAAILDVGCGSGRDMYWLKNHGFKPTGFEQSKGLVNLARKYSQCSVIEGDFTKYNFSSHQFDALLLIGALVHMPHSEFSGVLANISMALKQRGLINLSLKEGDGLMQHKDGRLFMFWRPEQLERIFADLGFEILDFSRYISALNEEDVWLNYILKKQEA